MEKRKNRTGLLMSQISNSILFPHLIILKKYELRLKDISLFAFISSRDFS